MATYTKQIFQGFSLGIVQKPRGRGGGGLTETSGQCHVKFHPYTQVCPKTFGQRFGQFRWPNRVDQP